MSNFNIEDFLEYLNFKLYSLYNHNRLNANELFNYFIETFSEVVDEFAPLRKATRKEKKLRQKLWISSGLLKSIKTKNKIFKRLHNHGDNFVLSAEYKAYQNTLNRPLRLAKCNYYHNFLNEHKGN